MPFVEEEDYFFLKTIIPNCQATRDYLSQGEMDGETDVYEQEVIGAFKSSQLKSVATKAQLAKFKAAARATAIKDRRAIKSPRHEASRA